ncbi:hypothetical protein IAE22_30515, partial [Bacillus sp. S34]|nr:hypothetical protein [Bacillus sp. S34]
MTQSVQTRGTSRQRMGIAGSVIGALTALSVAVPTLRLGREIVLLAEQESRETGFGFLDAESAHLPERQDDVVEDRLVREQVEVLEHHADATPETVGVPCRHVVAVEQALVVLAGGQCHDVLAV